MQHTYLTMRLLLLFFPLSLAFEIPLNREIPAIQSRTSVVDLLETCPVVNPRTQQTQSSAVQGLPLRRPTKSLLDNVLVRPEQKMLLVILPQLGDFDTFEYAEFLAASGPALKKAQISLRVLAIGDATSARKFASFSGLPIECLYVDSTATIHRTLELHQGPNWDVPSWIPNSVLKWFSQDVCGAKDDPLAVSRAWLNYMAMCAGLAAPDTLPSQRDSK